LLEFLGFLKNVWGFSKLIFGDFCKIIFGILTNFWGFLRFFYIYFWTLLHVNRNPMTILKINIYRTSTTKD